MSRLLLMAALTVTACGHGASRSTPSMTTAAATPAAEDTRALLALEKAVFQAIQSRDRAALTGLLAEDFVFRGPGDTELGREAFLDGVAGMPGTILSIQMEPVRAHVFGDTGVLTGEQRARVRLPDGSEVTDLQAFTDVCVRRGGRWWLVLAHSVPTGPEAAPEPAPGGP